MVSVHPAARPARRGARTAAAAWAAVAAVTLGACRQDMHDQPKLEPLERSRFFPDNRAARPIPAGTVARGQLGLDEPLATGKVAGRLVEEFPFEITRPILERGRERYEIYCSPCHDRTGSGRGMIVERGYPRPVSFHEQRLREAPPGHFFSAATFGFGVMPSYATQIPVSDRWAVVAYIRALQLSQHASLADVEPAIRRLLEAQSPGAPNAVPGPGSASGASTPPIAPAHGPASVGDDGREAGRDATAPGDVRGEAPPADGAGASEDAP